MNLTGIEQKPFLKTVTLTLQPWTRVLHVTSHLIVNSTKISPYMTAIQQKLFFTLFLVMVTLTLKLKTLFCARQLACVKLFQNPHPMIKFLCKIHFSIFSNNDLDLGSYESARLRTTYWYVLAIYDKVL